MIPYKELKKSSRRMKVKPTGSEALALGLIKRSGIPYRFQQVFGFYILDFLIPNRMLVVEIDGGYHEGRRKHDERRDEFCRKHGLKVLRLHNSQAHTVVSRIKRFSKIKGYKELVRQAKLSARRDRRTVEKKHGY